MGPQSAILLRLSEQLVYLTAVSWYHFPLLPYLAHYGCSYQHIHGLYLCDPTNSSHPTIANQSQDEDLSHLYLEFGLFVCHLPSLFFLRSNTSSACAAAIVKEVLLSNFFTNIDNL